MDVNNNLVSVSHLKPKSEVKPTVAASPSTPSVAVNLSESAKCVNVTNVSELDSQKYWAEVQKKFEQRHAASEVTQRALFSLHNKLEEISSSLENTKFANISYDIAIRENGTLKVVSEELQRPDRIELEKMLNKDEHLVLLATNVQNFTLNFMSKQAEDIHIYDTTDLEGIAINPETVEEGLHLKSLIQRMKSDFNRAHDMPFSEKAFHFPMFGIAQELKSNLTN